MSVDDVFEKECPLIAKKLSFFIFQYRKIFQADQKDVII